MNFLLISTLVIASVTFLPAITYGSATTEIEEQPHALPIVAANAAQKIAGEIWQEDDHEVLIRSERGAKNNGDGGAAVTEGSGKRRENKRPNHNKKNKNPGEKIERERTSERLAKTVARNEKPTKSEKSAKSDKREKSQKKSCKFLFSFLFHFIFLRFNH